MSNQQSNKPPLAQFKLTVELTCEVSELSNDEVADLYGDLSDEEAQAYWEVQRQMLRALLAEPDKLKVFAWGEMLSELDDNRTLSELLGELHPSESDMSHEALYRSLLKHLSADDADWWRDIIERDAIVENAEALYACFKARVVRVESERVEKSLTDGSSND